MFGFRIYLPMTASCGVFVICVGLGLVAGGLSPNFIYSGIAAGFVAGFIGMIAAAIIATRMKLGRPTVLQLAMPSICAVVEVALLLALMPYLPHDERTIFIVVLAVVGVHFLPMMLSYGPVIGLLGAACAAAAGIAWLTPGETLPTILLVDGALKIVFGIAMLPALTRRPPSVETNEPA
jgi:hypothetical protein